MPTRRLGDSIRGTFRTRASSRGGRSDAHPHEADTVADSALDDPLFTDGPDFAGRKMDAATKRVGGRDDGKTRILPPKRRDGGDAAPADRDDPMSDPPAGWLVVVRGPGQGRVLTLGNGMNAIGRGEAARVRIDFGDANISRVNHARVAYEPRARRWMLSHGDGSNLTYLNGEVVMSPVELQSGAEIQMGETTMRFQAFCSDGFDWSDLDD